MDCHQLKRYISKKKNPSQKDIEQIKNKYFLSIYLHSLFLHGILTRMNKDEDVDFDFGIDAEDILPILFQPYSSFLLTFGMMDGIEL